MNCAWLIEVHSKRVINISFVWIDIENTKTCLFDYVEVKFFFVFCILSYLFRLFKIKDGDDDDGKVLGRFCGNTLPLNNSIISNTNSVIVRFRSDGFINYRGFQLNYTAIQPGKI